MKKYVLIPILGSFCILSACSMNTFSDVDGKTGVSLNNGSVSINISPCSTGVDYIDIKGKNINGIEQNYANFIADEPQKEPFSINIYDPEEPWRLISDVSLPTEEESTIIISAGSLIENEQSVQTNTTIGEISKLQEGEVLTTISGKNTIVSQETFNSCE